MTHEVPEVVLVGTIEAVVLGPGERDEECSCSRFLFMDSDLVDTLEEE